MTDSVDIPVWMEDLIGKLHAAFEDRLVFVGLQGSRARGEARADSDIDVVVLIDSLSTDDLQTYKDVLTTMPHSDKACGFVASPAVLAGWPRYDSFNLVMDTKTFYGSLDFMDTNFTAEEALAAARAGASEIYHAMCHGLLFDGDALADMVGACIKSSFFVMRALTYVKTGEYPGSRSRMRGLATTEEAVFLDAYNDPCATDATRLAKSLLQWTEHIYY